MNGMDVFRVFDALNDLRNLRTSIAAVKRTGKHAEGTISYTISPVHTTEAFVEMAQQLKEMGCDSICIKDMAGLLKPQAAFDLVSKASRRGAGKTPWFICTHMRRRASRWFRYMKAIEAGCDIVDTSVSSMSLGPGHNPTEALVEMLEGTGFETRLDLKRILRVRDHFAKIRPRYREFLSEFSGVDTEIFKSQIPGGMISNMESQLKGQGAADRLHDVLDEVPRVRKDAGYPPLVTPSSQIVGTQAVFNVLMGPYKVMTGEFADLMLGYYGTTMGEKNPEIVKKASEHAKKQAIDIRPADLLKPEWEQLRTSALALEGCNGSDEDVLTYAMFPQVAPKFFKTRSEGPKNLGRDPGAVLAKPAPTPAASDKDSAPESPSHLRDHPEWKGAQGYGCSCRLVSNIGSP